MMRAPLIKALVTAAALVAAAPVLATSDVRTARVAHADLNLASPEGRAALDRRVTRAINRVCGAGEQRELALMMRERRCVAYLQAETRIDIASIERHADTALAQNTAGTDVAAR